MRKLPLILLVIMSLLGCQSVHPTVPSLGSSQASVMAAAAQRSFTGRVDFSALRTACAELSRSIQAAPTDVVNASTVSLIDSTNTTVATGLTDSNGNFTLTLGSYTPINGATYLLEAVKGLNKQAPGVDAARFRTILKWNGTGWLSCTNNTVGGGIVINALTTAVAIESYLDPVNVPPANTMGKINATVSPATINSSPGPYTSHPDSQINALATDLLNFLATNTDPLGAVPSILPSISSFSPSSGAPGTLMLIQGAGFSPSTTVTVNGVSSLVLIATATSLVATVPAGATSGTIQVQTARGTTTCGPFTVTNTQTPLVISGFSPSFGGADTVVTLTGQFGTAASTPSVTFTGNSGPLPAAVTAWTPTSMTVIVPIGIGDGLISVQAGTTTASTINIFDSRSGDVSLMNNITSTTAGTGYTLPTTLSWQAGVATGSYYYVVAGSTANSNATVTNNVYMYPINTDGSLGVAKAVGTLNTARYAHAAAIYGNYLYALGGINSAGTFLTSIERAAINPDGSLGPFTQIGSLQSARDSFSAIVYGNTLYVLGGYNGSTSLSSVERYTINADGSLTYVATYTMTVGGSAITNYAFGCMVVGTGLVIVGGYWNGGYSANTATIPINADGTLGNGTAGPTMPAAQYATQCAIYNNELYVVSGYNGSSWTGNVFHATVNPANGAITTGFTSTATQLYSAGTCCALLLTGNRLYTFGGNGGSPNAVIQTALINADKSITAWSKLGALTYTRWAFCGQMLNNKAWLIGGYNSSVGALSNTEYFTIRSDGTLGPSTLGPSTTLVRMWSSGFSANGYFYVVGGGDNGGNYWDTVERATINSDGTLGPFTLLPGTLNMARWEHSCTVVGNYVYVFGGSNGTLLNTIERAKLNSDGSLGIFELINQTFPEGRMLMGNPVIIGNLLYLVGGNTGGVTAQVYMAQINPDGSLGSFGRAPNLGTAVYAASVGQIGNYLYCIGGNGPTSLVERASINPDGTLSAWANDQPGGRDVLPVASCDWTNAPYVYNNNIYIFSGYNGGTYDAIAQGTLN